MSADTFTSAAIGGAAIDDALSADLAAASLMLARRFAAGATLWCISPEWEPHANHVAVEFVHPVIVGKKALPAVALTGPDLVGTVRVSVRAGDVVVAVASAAEASVRSVMRRAPAWGASTLWIGSGARPTAGAADHVLWLDDPDPRLPATGGFVLLYHLLWELTHVCFEHPGLLSTPTDECTEDVCITCSDEGRLAEVMDVETDRAWVRAAGGPERVDTMLVEAVEPGDLLLIHAGMAISKLDEGPGR
jgi:hydrogenase maturation factor